MVVSEHPGKYIDADLRDNGAILIRAAELLDFSRPVAVTMLTILHAMPDSDDPYAIVARIMNAISHAGSDLLDPEGSRACRPAGAARSSSR